MFLYNQDTKIIPVKHLQVDLHNYYSNTFIFRYVDYQVTTEYIDPYSYHLIIRRLDGGLGSTDELQIMTVFTRDYCITHQEIISLESWHDSYDCIRKITTTFIIEPDLEQPYTLRTPLLSDFMSYVPYYTNISRKDFNLMFHTDVVVLPTSMFAIGCDSHHRTFIYHEGLGSNSKEFNNIRAPCQHILRVLNSDKGLTSLVASSQLTQQEAKLPNEFGRSIFLPLYFIISSTDGYIENTYCQPSRTIPRIVSEFECNGLYLPPSCADNEYLVFHKHRYILTQSAHVDLPYTILIPDRHYFFHNLNHSFRSFHQGVAWDTKIPKIVFAAQDRDTKYNFLDKEMRSLEIAPRKYFKEVIAPKHRDIIEYSDQWLDRTTMIYFKYILDIDGAASTWDATAWKLNSGSVIFKPRSSWSQWFYTLYLPDVHYIEILDDFSDLPQKYEWCESHPQECLQMIQRCQALFQQIYAYHNVIDYTKSILSQTHSEAKLPAELVVVGLQPTDQISVSINQTHSEAKLPAELVVVGILPTDPPYISKIHQYIDKVIYINLDKRTDRRLEFETQAELYGISYERFSAIPHSFGIVGCTMSHRDIYRLAKKQGYRNILIFEDDFEFLVSPTEFENEIIQLFESNTDFDVCMLAYNLKEYSPCQSPHLLRVFEAQTASAYIVNMQYYDVLAQLYDCAIPLLEKTRHHWLYANDQAWKALQSMNRWYCTKTRIGKQRDGFSDNAQEYVSYQC
jgi:glycosyl transferase family 25